MSVQYKALNYTIHVNKPQFSRIIKHNYLMYLIIRVLSTNTRPELCVEGREMVVTMRRVLFPGPADRHPLTHVCLHLRLVSIPSALFEFAHPKSIFIFAIPAALISIRYDCVGQFLHGKAGRVFCVRGNF